MPNFTISTAVNSFQSLQVSENGTVTATGTIAVAGGNAVHIDLTGIGGTTILDNYGTISSPTAEAVALVGTATSPTHMQIFNRAGAILGGHTSVFTVGANFAGGTLTIDNAGTINGSIFTNLERDIIISTDTINGGISTDAGNDTITLGGLAAVSGMIDGGLGTDSLTADYTGAAYHPDFIARTITSSGGSFGGVFFSNNAETAAWLRFQSIENLALTFGSEQDQVVVNLAALANGATISLDGGTGTNRLSANFSGLGNTSFAVAANGSITSNQGSYARFQQFALTLGSGTNTITTGALDDTINAGAGTHNLDTGAGRDQIFTVDGTVMLNAGADYDQWSADFSGASAAIATTFNGVSASLSNGSSASGLEDLFLRTGSGNDIVTTTGGILRFYGGTGTDTLNADFSGKAVALPYATHLIAHDPSGFFGSFAFGSNIDNSGFAAVSGVENLNVTLADGDDRVELDMNVAIGTSLLNLDGGLGSNTLAGDLSAISGVTFKIVAGGAITSNLGSLARFQTFEFQLGGGTNSVTTGAGSDVFTSATGADSINGGDGDDRWTGNYQASSAIAFVLNGNRGIFDRSEGVTSLSNIETMIVALGTQADSGTITAPSGSLTSLHGGSGADSLTIDFSGLIGDGVRDTASIASNDSGGFDGEVLNDAEFVDYLANPGNRNVILFRSFEHVVATMGSDADYITVTAASTRSGATLIVDGGAGQDGVAIAGQSWGYTITQIAPGSYLINDTNVTDGDNGVFTISNVEEVYFSFSSETLQFREGTAGNDRLTPLDEFNPAWLYGYDGNDILTGGFGNDQLYGGAGDDLMVGGEGLDRMEGGAGDDTYYVEYSSEIVFEAVDGGIDTVVARLSEFTLPDHVENLKLTGPLDLSGTGNVGSNIIRGNAGINVIIGLAGDDKLRGGANDDQLLGDDGEDRLFGGDGNDNLYGGMGWDILSGGDGTDWFNFDVIETAANFDKIGDFTQGSDKLVFHRSVFTGFSADPSDVLDPLAFTLGTTATTADHRLVYDQNTGSLYYDNDGAGGEDQVLVAVLANHSALASTDFLML